MHKSQTTAKKPKQEWRWRECAWGGPAKLRLIVIAEGLAMVRHKGCAAFVISEKEWLAMKPVKETVDAE